MKIVITGAMGVGKSTLANMLEKELRKQIEDIYVLPEIAREMIAEGYNMDYGVTLDFERDMLYRQTLLEIEDNYIADRGIIDIMAYTSVIFLDNFDKEGIIGPNDIALDLLNKINEEYCKAKYDIIFYLPPEFPIEDDGVRSTDVVFQKQIDQKIKDILSTGSFKWYTLSGSRQKRLKQALKHLTSVK